MDKKNKAELFLQQPPSGGNSKASNKYLRNEGRNSQVKSQIEIRKKDEKDNEIQKLKRINTKLRSRLKDLNLELEEVIDKTKFKRKSLSPVKNVNNEELEAKMAENHRKLIENYKLEIERLSNQPSKEQLEKKIAECKQKRKELEKVKHDLELELDDFSEEKIITQPINEGELLFWNEKNKKKQQINNESTTEKFK